MFEDPFMMSVDSPSAPAALCFSVTPNDLADLPRATKAIYIGQGGDVALVSVRSDVPVIFRNVPAGAILDVRVQAVRATGTTADHIIGLA